MRRFLSLHVFLLLVAAAGCRHPATATDASPLAPTGAAPDDPAAGRKLYIAKCARCHKLYDPNSYTDAAWRDWMDKMSRKAKLKPDQQELLAKYVDTLRANKTNAP